MWFLNSDTVEKWCWQQIFTKEECEKIIEICEKIGTKNSLLENNVKDETIRKSNTCFLPINEDTKWIFERICKIVIFINDKYFNYDLIGFHELQYTKYEKDCFYDKHIDSLYNVYSVRKLSISIQLSDPSSYDGGDLLLHYAPSPDVAKKEQGVLTAFNSLTLHEVTPVSRGERMALVCWVVGPKFK